VTQRNFVHPFRRHQIAAQHPGDALAVFFCYRRVKLQSVCGIPLPAETHKRESLPQQPSVARVALGVPVSTVDNAQNSGMPAIRALENHRAVALARIFRPDRDEIRVELDFAFLQRNRVGEVDDATVVFVRDRKRDVDTADDAFVWAGVAE
jgi:hypothetical protein